MISLPRISIIISSFNQGAYLEQAIRSVIEQGYPDLELIVIDGGSRDRSLAILEKYAPELAHWESGPDRGQAHAINKGFARATGDVITFLSSDDYYLPGALGDVAEKYRRNQGAGAIVGAFCFLDEGSSRPGDPQPPSLDGGSPADLSLGPPGVYRLHQVSTFFCRQALDQVGRCVREDLKYVMDRELLYRICRANPIACSEQPYGVFRRHSGSKSVSEILPFAREFAGMYLSFLSGELQLDRRRRKMARYRLMRGYVKYAHALSRRPGRLVAMLHAARVYPENLLAGSYWRSLARLLR